MIIDPSTPVQPPKLAVKALRQTMGDLIGKADTDEALAAFYWQCEARMVKDVGNRWSRFRDHLAEQLVVVRSMIDEEPVEGAADWSVVSDDYRAAWTALYARIVDLHAQAEGAVAQCEGALRAMADVLGESQKHRYSRGEVRECSPVDDIGHLDRELLEAHHVWERIPADGEAHVETLEILASRREAFVLTEASRSLETIDRLYYGDFERLVARVLERDGFAIERWNGGPGDRGADVIAISPEDARIVVQCKHSQCGRVVGERDVQCVNGTARQSHRADIVVIATNTGFSAKAREFASDQRIHLIDRAVLRRWITWGDHFGEIVPIGGRSTT